MNALTQDLRHALRRLLDRPGLTAIAVLSMALGLGVSITAFGVLYSLLLRPLPFAEPGRIVAVSMTHPGHSDGSGSWSYPDYLDLRRESTVFASLAAHRGAGSVTLTGLDGPERIEIDAVSFGLFPLLGVDPVLGRHFLPEEDRPDAPPVILLSHRLWQRRFHGDPGVIGQTVTASGKPHQIVGVMPPGFEHPDARQAWIPLGNRWVQGGRSVRILQVEARLRPGVTLEQARAEVGAIVRRLAARHPRFNAGWSAGVEPIRNRLLPVEERQPLFILLGAAGCVLLLACANVANLLLAEAGGRERELAVRAALGAGRGRILRQLLTENVLLALAGGAFSLLLSAWGLSTAAEALAPFPYWARFGLDGMILLFALALSVVTGLVFGLIPAFQATRIDVRRTLKDGGGSRRRPAGALGLRAGVVVGEVALALVLLVGTSLLGRSFLELRKVDPGFDAPGVLAMWTTLQGDAYAGIEARGRQANAIAQRVADLPGIESAGVGPMLLFGGGTLGRITLEGQAQPAGQEPSLLTLGVTPGYFSTLGVPVLRGRAFTEQESVEGAPVALVNRAFAQQFFPRSNPVGRRLRLLDREGTGWIRIIGVAGELRTNLWEPAGPQVYLPPRYEQLHTVGIFVRTGLDPEQVTKRVWQGIRTVDPDLPIYNVLPMEQVLELRLAVERTVSQGFALFGAIALFLAAIGVYGVLSCSVAQRLQELGVRIALGAGRPHVLGLVLVRGMSMTLAGIGIGVAAALSASRLLSRMLYGVSPMDPASFLAVPLLLLGVAFFACWVPARRAMDTDPVQAIRSE